jgi:hypothetical protein
MLVPFDLLPDHTRIWIYQSSRKFNSSDIAIISEALSAFTGEWGAHGIQLSSSFDVQYNQFVVLAADEQQQAASGCSIDDSVRTIKNLGNKLGVDLFDRKLVAFWKEGEVISVPLENLKREFEKGTWNGRTLVFNNLINRKGELKTSWLIPAELSWLKRYLSSETIAG